MVKNNNAPLDAEQRRRIQEAMRTNGSLAEFTREATPYRVIKYLLEDKSSLERYLTEMAGLITKQRLQISHTVLIRSIFHVRKALSRYNEDFLTLLTETVERERKIQVRVFIADNHLQANIHSDLWKLYARNGDALRVHNLKFSLIRCTSLQHELKYYLRHIMECTGMVTISFFSSYVLALNTLIDVNPKIRYFADITETDAKALLLFFENSYRKKDGSTLSQRSIATVITNIRRVIEYLMSDMRNEKIKAPLPHMNPFANFTFHNLRSYQTPTSAIPEDIIEQINKFSDELPSLDKLLYDIFVSTGLRLKEVFFLETDCIEDSRYDGICQLKFKPYKVLAARRRNKAGDYHRVMIPQALADKILCHIKGTVPLNDANGSSYIFLSKRSGFPNSVIDSRPFIKAVRNIITKHDIRDEDGELWHFTIKQFRKTIAVTLIENGATTAELAYWLGHMSSITATRYYAEVRKMKLAELNNKFFKEKFDLILSCEQLEEYTEEERKLLYTDFRLEQRRVELGYCLGKAVNGCCPNRNSLYNCVNCKNLCTGKKYLPYWNELLIQQKEIVERLILAYHASDIERYVDFAEYKQELRLLNGYKNIVAAIEEGGK